jgi:hypothetical protein
VNHVLIGAFLPFLICAVLYAARGFRAGGALLVLGPLAMLASGFVAIIPDLPRLWGNQVLYVEWHHRSWCNLAWGHCAIDRHDRIDSWPGFAVLFVLCGAVILAAAWRELRLAERGR